MGRFCLFSFIFQLPFYTLVFSEWGCFFLLVRLGRGDTKDFLSLSKKAPPQLSGFLACRYGRRRGGCGTRSAQTVLALFPPSPLRLRRPIKAESGIVTVAVFFNPSVLRTPPLYFAAQNTEEEGEMYFPFASAPILYVTPLNAT